MNSKYVATIFSASAVMAYFNPDSRLRMYTAINPAPTQPPQLAQLSYMTTETLNPLLNIPLAYITDVLFGQTAYGPVQGMLTSYPTTSPQQMEVITAFATSQPILLFLIMIIAFTCALVVTWLSHWPVHARRG